jgi:putative chitinase
VIGYCDDASYPGGGYFIVNDPFGELDHASGSYSSENGSKLKYSYALMDARWTVPGESDGWSIIIHKKAEAPALVELVSKGDLAHIWNCAESLIKDWEIEEMNACLRRFDITTTERIRHFLSQTAHESGGGRWMKELSDGEYLEGRTDIGNTEPGDGPRFKGAGYLQLTGRANYEVLARRVEDPRVMEGVEYVAATYPFTSGGVWWDANKMNQLIDSGANVEQVTRRVNGGYNGLADRKYYYSRAKEVI